MDYKKLLCVGMFLGILKAAERDLSLPDVESLDYNEASHLSDGKTIYKTQLSVRYFARPECILSEEPVSNYLDRWYRSDDGVFVFLELSEDLAPKNEAGNVELLDGLAGYGRHLTESDDQDDEYELDQSDAATDKKSKAECRAEKKDRPTLSFVKRRTVKEPLRIDFETKEEFIEHHKAWERCRERNNKAVAASRTRKQAIIDELLLLGIVKSDKGLMRLSDKKLMKFKEKKKGA